MEGSEPDANSTQMSFPTMPSLYWKKNVMNDRYSENQRGDLQDTVTC
jgi:hypothetical protein